MRAILGKINANLYETIMNSIHGVFKWSNEECGYFADKLLTFILVKWFFGFTLVPL